MPTTPRPRRPAPDAQATFAGPQAAAAFLADLLGRPGVPGADLELLGAGHRLRLRLRVDPPPRPPSGPAPVSQSLTRAALATLLARRAQAAGVPIEPTPAGGPGAQLELADALAEAEALEADLRRLLGDLEQAEGTLLAEGVACTQPDRVERVLRLRRGLAELVDPK